MSYDVGVRRDEEGNLNILESLSRIKGILKDDSMHIHGRVKEIYLNGIYTEMNFKSKHI